MSAEAAAPAKSDGDRLLATRLAVIQTLYSSEVSREPHVQRFAWLDETAHQPVDERLYQTLHHTATAHHDEIVALLLDALQQRRWHNIDLTTRCLLICGCAELLAGINDTALVMSLYCRISDGFNDDHIGKFINGVLHNCAQKIAADR